MNPDALRLKKFLEEDPLALEASRPLKPGACIRIVLPDGEYFYHLRNGRPRLEPDDVYEPDVTLRVPGAALDELLSTPEPSIPAYGLKILELADTDDPERKIRASVHSGVFRLWRHGYFSYFWMGGREFLDYLRRKGLGSIHEIQKRLRASRKSPD